MASPLRDGDPPHIGPYRVHSRLGGGGMGQVFLGRSPGGRLVAVKVVRPELADDTQFRRRFAAEVEAARKVGGFYTAQVVDADPNADPPWLATAYVPGPSLHQAIDDHGPLPLASVAVLGAGLAEGLAAVHACEVVHRDLKPGNVILAEDGPRLIDFGIARAMDATSHTQTSTVLGTPAFMSPEQAMAQIVGPASDVFSLGCVLAFAATGRSPFGEGPAHAVIFRVVHADPDLSGVTAPLAGLVAACLAKDPSARPTVQQVLVHLTALASPGDGRESWLPEALTQVIAERRTLTLTAVEHPVTGTDGPQATPSPQPAQTNRLQPQPLLVNERRRTRDGGPVYPATGYQLAVYVLLALFALASVSAAVYQIIAADHDEQLRLAGLHVSGDTIEDNADMILVIQVILGVMLVVSWLLWFRQVRTVAEQLAPGRLRYRPSMAVLAWFIPLANFILPKQIADDVWHASSTPGHGGGTTSPVLLNTWWIAWLGTFLTWPLFWWRWTDFFRAQTDLSQTVDGERFHPSDVTPTGWIILALHLLAVPTAIVTALYVRRLSAMQAERLTS
ncbi:protein kinase [Nonomuraea wenchangensis]